MKSSIYTTNHRSYRSNTHSFTFRDPGSAITHLIAMIAAIIAAPALIQRAVQSSHILNVICMSVFISSMILLYGASTAYHSFDLTPEKNLLLKKLDHCMIFVLIVGSYTPVCLIVLHGTIGFVLFGIVAGIGLLGIIFKLCWVTCPRWISSVLYIAMGWVCLLAFAPIIRILPAAAFGWLLAGGIIYTIGGVIYALKLPVFNSLHKNFGSHEIFHLFVMAGSFCHYIMMYVYVATMTM